MRRIDPCVSASVSPASTWLPESFRDATLATTAADVAAKLLGSVRTFAKDGRCRNATRMMQIFVVPSGLRRFPSTTTDPVVLYALNHSAQLALVLPCFRNYRLQSCVIEQTTL